MKSKIFNLIIDFLINNLLVLFDKLYLNLNNKFHLKKCISLKLLYYFSYKKDNQFPKVSYLIEKYIEY